MAGRLPRRRFEACSVFTRVAARAVRCPPKEVFSSDASGHSSPPDPSEVLPAGARAAGWGSNPPNRDTFGQGTHVNTLEGFWSLLRSWLRPHRGLSQEKLPLYLGFFQFVHNARQRGRALLGALVAALVT
jgi:hypothetical protein